MSRKIPQAILKQTVNCEHEFACLKDEYFCDAELCKIDYINGENVIFLKSKEPHNCPYRITFAGQMVCTCPVRYYQLKSNI